MARSSRSPGRGLIRNLLTALRAQVANWYVVGPLAWLILRCPPQPFLAKTKLSALKMVIRLRDGRSMVCQVSEFPAFAEVFLAGEYEVPGLVDWDSLHTIVDVGANVGMAALWFASRSPKARIIAVEPGPSALSRLRVNIARNGLGERITIKPVALGKAAGRGRLVGSGASVGLRVEEESERTRGQVPVITLAELVEESGFERVDLLKLDCEGAEYNILSACGGSGLSRVQHVVGEYHVEGGHTPAELEGILRSAGFTPSLRRHPRDPALGSFSASRA